MRWTEVVPLAGAQFPEAPGLYKFSLAEPDALSGTLLADLPEGALLYIGKAEEGLRTRHVEQHLREESSWSTFRRSLGAVLREKLDLEAVPRRGSPHKSNYSFDPDGERRLTLWMRLNLSVSWATVSSVADLATEEERLIRELRPALNIKHNAGGQYVPELKRLRALCRDEMRRQLRLGGSHEELEFRIDGPMMTAGAGAWGGVGAAKVRLSQERLTSAIAQSQNVTRLREWLARKQRLGVKVEFHLAPRRAKASDLDNLLHAMFNTLVEAAGFSRPPGKPIPQTKDALFWQVEAEKVLDANEHTVIRIRPLTQ